MKDRKLLFAFFSLFFLLQCAPKKIFFVSENSEIKSIIENRQFDVVYRGLKYRMTIFVPGADSIQVSGIGFQVQKVEKNKYDITPGGGKSLEIKIIGFFERKEVIEKRQLRILNIGIPHASIDYKIGKIKLSKQEVFKSTIEVHFPQFIFETPIVKSFLYQINKEEPVTIYGNKFDKMALEKIGKMKSGDSILIDNIKAFRELPNVDYSKIKELKVYIE